MPKLNKFLVASIIADIKECVCVSNEIYSWLGDIEHLSWKFPTKTARDINAMEIVREHNGTAGEFYILLLELAYDRIHFLLRLIVEFMDKFPFMEDLFKEVNCVRRSSQISLASLVRLVWDRLKTIPDSISRQMVKNCKDDAQESFASKVSQSSQAGSSMSYCESCTLAGMAIIQAINEIEQVFGKNKLVSVAAAERNECKNDIYERTQWAVMSRLSRGIGRDVETALSIVKETNLRTQAVKRDHDQAIRELGMNMRVQEERTEALRADNSNLKDLLENAKEKLAELENSSAVSKEEKETLEEELNDTRSRMSMLAGENNVLQSQTVALAESKLELEKTVIGLRKEIVAARDAYLETERHYQALLDESRKENDSLKNEHEQKVEQLHQEIASLRAQISNKKDKKKTKNAEDNGPVNQNQDGTILKPEDDPVADMTQQLISNREKIELLSRQNERLSKTLCRLREYRQTAATGPNK